MKVIDLLNIWVTDKAKLPKKIKVGNKTFLYNEGLNLYVTPDKQCYLIQNYLDCIGKSNKKVEVIEEKKEIEELKADAYTSPDVLNKINEVIRAVKKINKQLEEQETEDIDTVERELNKMF